MHQATVALDAISELSNHLPRDQGPAEDGYLCELGMAQIRKLHLYISRAEQKIYATVADAH